MAHPIKQQLAADLDKVKAQGGDRLQRIQEILRTAFSEAASEVKAGGQEVKAASKESLRSVVQTVSSRQPAEAMVTVEASAAPVDELGDGVSVAMADQIAADAAMTDGIVVESAIADGVFLEDDKSIPTSEPSTLKILEDLLKATGLKAKSIAREQCGRLETQLPERSEQLRSKAQDWDEQLAERYGEDYAGLKQRFAKALTWYKEKLSQGRALKTQSAEQKEGKRTEELGELGVKVAQKEEAIKQQIGQALRTITVNAQS